MEEEEEKEKEKEKRRRFAVPSSCLLFVAGLTS